MKHIRYIKTYLVECKKKFQVYFMKYYMMGPLQMPNVMSSNVLCLMLSQVYTSGSYQKLKKKNRDAALFNWAISWTISAISRLLPFPDFSNMESDRQLSFRDGAIIPSDHPNIIVHSIIITITDKSSYLITPISSSIQSSSPQLTNHPI